MKFLIEKLCNDFLQENDTPCPNEETKMDELHDNFFATLTQEQQMLFFKYKKATDDYYYAHENALVQYVFKHAFRLAIGLFRD